jgi:hypothetical protein
MDCFFEAASVVPKLMLVLVRLLKEFKKLLFQHLLGFRELIVDAVTIPAIHNETRVLKVREVAGNIRLRGFQHVLNITDAEFSMEEEVQYAQPVRVSESLEVAFQFFHSCSPVGL